MRVAFLVALGAVAGCSQGSAVEETKAAEQDMIHGEWAGSQYAAVGALAENGDLFCTATLIAPRLVITAQHCIEGGSEENPQPKKPSEVEFRLGSNAKAPDRGVRLKRWIAAPDFEKPDYAEYASDVTLAELESPITDVTPIPASLRPVTEAEVGTNLESVGFGVQDEKGFGEIGGQQEMGNFKLIATSGNGLDKRFGGRAKFDEAFKDIDPDGNGDKMWFLAQVHAGYEVFTYSQRSETCYGDSGGPLMRKVGGKLEVVGVVSTGFPGVRSSCLHLGTMFAVFGPKTVQMLQQNGVR